MEKLPSLGSLHFLCAPKEEVLVLELNLLVCPDMGPKEKQSEA